VTIKYVPIVFDGCVLMMFMMFFIGKISRTLSIMVGYGGS
jgi:hypothetical protein